MIIIDFISISLLWVLPWGLCEFAHWKKNNGLLDEIKILRASDRKQRLENAALKDRVQTLSQKIAELEKLEQTHLRVIEAVRDRARESRDEIDFDEIEFGDAPLPAAANEAVEGQHFSDYVRVTGKLVIGAIAGSR